MDNLISRASGYSVKAYTTTNAAFALDCVSISNLYESVYTKGYHERGWKSVRAESRSDCLLCERLGDGHTNYFL